MKTLFKTAAFAVCILFTGFLSAYSKNPQSYYILKVYHYKTPQQEAALHQYLEKAYLPALHRNGVKQAGVFGTFGQDTTDRRIYVFIPVASLDKAGSLDEKVSADKAYTTAAGSYVNAAYNASPYNRLEVIILKAFSGMPSPAVPALTGNKADRVYELRSYESATEKYHENKVAMFNAGDEIAIFKRLGFNAVFYSQVVAGSRMPNLMYMTVHADAAAREANWKAFGNDAAWKTLSAKEEYKNNVSKIDITFLKSAEYSDF
ncbi:NIPSNAP family containing protein [Mucilaginibacter limnophilus]|uniref:NIPSNAP family containing protein n=1 Tax=Mucilaginibacter limnophilus TaxID=1932778 RepID=A0A437MYL8_9SPHI|nr:NIPSNAP family protein [Mucilaginibacter limnophilus]RVU02696.1 NIPSNAP family containing protein [Mucilaginibacter limnophilus]